MKWGYCVEYLHKDRGQFAEAINVAAYKNRLEPEIVEKDYYVTMVLKQLADRFNYVVFKGGTSLSKCYQVIHRFSEDIDITADSDISQGQKKKLKQGIVEIAEELGLSIPNIGETRSRRDYNRYELEYDSVLERLSDTVNPVVLMETSFAEVSFPTVMLPVHSYIGDLILEEAPEAVEEYGLNPFDMKVQGIDRTLADKIFAICDYYLKGEVKKHSRHLYDISQLLPLVPQDEHFRILVSEVRRVRAKTNICPSSKPGVNVSELLDIIIRDDVYKEDYNILTTKLLEEPVSYEEAIRAIRIIANRTMFDE